MNSSIWPVDGTVTDTTTPDQNGVRSNENEGVLYIPQSPKNGASPSDGLVSYPGHLLEESYPSAEMQSVYSTVPANWAEISTLTNHSYITTFSAQAI